MNGYFINSGIIQLDRKGVTIADIKHIINQRTQRAVYTMGTQSAVGAFMSQNNVGSALVLADGTGNQPGDVCTIISRTPDVSPERWDQHQYEAVVRTPEQLVSNGTLIDRESVYEQLRQTVELRAPEFEQSPTLQPVPVTPGTTVLLPNDGQSSSIIIHDATTEQVLLNIANDGAGWYITGMVPNNWFASISGDIFNLGTLAMSPQKWAYTHQVNLNYFYPVFISTVITTPVVAPVGVTAVWSETPMPNRQLGIHLDHEYTELTDDWDLQIDIGDYRYRMEKVGGLGNNFVTYQSLVKVGTPDGGTDWIADTPAKHEVTVTPDNIVRILAVTGPDGSFGVTQNRLFQYMTTLNGDSDLTLSVPVHIASYGLESRLQAAWVDYHTLVPEVLGFQEVPTWNLPFVDGVPQFDHSGGEFYAEFNDIGEVSAAQATGLGQKAVLWTPPAQQLVMEHCRDLLIEVRQELSAARGNELSNILAVLNNILAKP